MKAKNVTHPTNIISTQRLAFFDLMLKTKPLHWWSIGELTGNTTYDRGSDGVDGTISGGTEKGIFDKVGTCMCFDNGDIEKTYTYGGPLANKPATTRIGTSGSYHFDGMIDEVAIWDRCLLEYEVEKLTKLSGVI